MVPACIGQLCRADEFGRYYGTCYFVASLATLVSTTASREGLTNKYLDLYSHFGRVGGGGRCSSHGSILLCCPCGRMSRIWCKQMGMSGLEMAMDGKGVVKTD